MDKLFEIPGYAMDKDTLMKRYDKYCENYRRESVLLEASEETIRRCIEIEAYPQRLWQYNHIVGYIMIGINGQDIDFKVYLPIPKIEKYFWKSKKKNFLYDIRANGAYCRIEKNYTNDYIQQEIEKTLQSIIKEHVPNNYYVDLECFIRLNKLLDYKMLVE